MRGQLPLFLLILLANVFDPTVAKGEAMVGGWRQIKDVEKDSHAREIGSFAVSEYNRAAHAQLSFVRVLEGQTQVVAGFNYRLLIEAKNDEASKIYKAVVWEKAWESFMNLTSFEPVLP